MWFTYNFMHLENEENIQNKEFYNVDITCHGLVCGHQLSEGLLVT